MQLIYAYLLEVFTDDILATITSYYGGGFNTITRIAELQNYLNQ